ncbi:MAG: DUF4167 domain-containing protein, partial [Sphingobium sp.]
KDRIESKDPSLINNRQAGRRNRGRNNGRPSGNANRSNGDNGNRIDNRARGNAPQLLEKYRNMARDAQLAGDRVNAEYYLQFADHYFRVIADNRSRQEDPQPRPRRNDEGFDDYGVDAEGGYEESGNQAYADSSGYDENGEPQREREAYEPNRNRQPREQREAGAGQNNVRNRDQRPVRDNRDNRDNRPREQREPREQYAPAAATQPSSESVPQSDSYQPIAADVPATPDAAYVKPQTRRAPRARAPRDEQPATEPALLDLAVLPPAISRPENDVASNDTGNATEAPVAAPKRRGRPPRAAVQAAE